MNRISKHKGVTLLEVLVAIVITSIGMLGFTSLQYLGLNSNQSAYARSQASFIATNLSERMRINMDGVNANNYAGLDSATVDCNTIPANYCDQRNNAGVIVEAGLCDAAQLAAFDFFVTVCGASSNDYSDHTEKTSFIEDLLPGGRIQVSCNDSDATSSTTGGTTTGGSTTGGTTTGDSTTGGTTTGGITTGGITTGGITTGGITTGGITTGGITTGGITTGDITTGDSTTGDITTTTTTTTTSTRDSDSCTDSSDHTITVSWSEQDEDATNVGGDNSGANIRTRVQTKTIRYRFNP